MSRYMCAGAILLWMVNAAACGPESAPCEDCATLPQQEQAARGCLPETGCPGVGEPSPAPVTFTVTNGTGLVLAFDIIDTNADATIVARAVVQPGATDFVVGTAAFTPMTSSYLVTRAFSGATLIKSAGQTVEFNGAGTYLTWIFADGTGSYGLYGDWKR